MKTLKLHAGLCVFLLSLFAISCSDDLSNSDDNPNPNPPGELVLFAIDTARINTITATGTNETTIIDRMENLNSYFSDLSISPDGTKLAYTNFQSSGTVPDMVYVREVRVADVNGSNDHVVFSSDEAGVSPGTVKYCNDNKIFFVVETFFPDVTRTAYLVNSNGTGLQTLTGQYNVADISNDRNYYILKAAMGANNPSVAIIDRNGDGGAGGMYHNEVFEGIDEFSISEGVFTADGNLALVAYRDGNEIKARVIDMQTKTSTTKTLVSGLGDGWLSYHLEMAGDSNRGVITLTGEGFAKSKSYVFNLSTGEVAAPFENNDENIFDVYIH